MSEVATDFAAARENMVNSQLAPARVSDPRILAAMRRLPRELFAPPGRAGLAYIDKDVPLGNGRVMMEPRVVARLAQAALPHRGERALVLGASYGAALLAALGVHVVALEEEEALLERARAACAAADLTVELRHGRLVEGLPGAPGKPFDIVLVEGAVAHVPDAIVRSLAPEGRLVAVLQRDGEPGRGVFGERSGEGLSTRPLFDAGTARIPGFDEKPVFAF